VPDDNRLVIRTIEPHTAPSTLADDVRAGLAALPKRIPPKYFYDDLGSKLFDAICLLPEYYPTRAEREILARSAGEIVASVGSTCELVELGSGNAHKTRFLIEALLARQSELHYVPVDISSAALEASALELLGSYPALRITAYASEYMGALERLPRIDCARLALFLGSNIGNFDHPEALGFLRGLRTALRAGDALLLGADLKKARDVLEAAYDDPLGVTAAFNLNLLARLNRELGADFDLRRFAHRAFYDEALERVEMHLVSLTEQTVRIADLGLEVRFAEGETIHTENSYKYDVEGLTRLAAAAGFERTRTWFDDARRFSSNLFVAV
jgi:L-histidine N-alpha-methyltransferase